MSHVMRKLSSEDCDKVGQTARAAQRRKLAADCNFGRAHILKTKSSFTAYIYTKKLLAIFLLKSWELL